MREAPTSVGAALRNVRARRGLTVDDAARDTRIRREFIEALESERFDRLLGEVHVRGCLRTYAAYLHLPAEEVIAAYASGREDALAGATPSPAPPLRPDGTLRRRRDDHRLLGMVAATLLVLAAAFGVLSSRDSAPPPADLDAVTSAPPLRSEDVISVGVFAIAPVRVTVAVDGAPERTFDVAPGEGRSFEAHEALTIRLSDGGAARLTVAGTDVGVPGASGRPWRQTYRTTSSASGSPSSSLAPPSP